MEQESLPALRSELTDFLRDLLIECSCSLSTSDIDDLQFAPRWSHDSLGKAPAL